MVNNRILFKSDDEIEEDHLHANFGSIDFSKLRSRANVTSLPSLEDIRESSSESLEVKKEPKELKTRKSQKPKRKSSFFTVMKPVNIPKRSKKNNKKENKSKEKSKTNLEIDRSNAKMIIIIKVLIN